MTNELETFVLVAKVGNYSHKEQFIFVSCSLDKQNNWRCKQKHMGCDWLNDAEAVTCFHYYHDRGGRYELIFKVL